jgi:hypothetical protein
VGHVVHSCAFGARNVIALFFMLGWARCISHKEPVGTCYIELVFLHPVGSTILIVHSGASMARNIDALFFMLVRPDVVSVTSASDTLRQTFVFAFGRICGSRSAIPVHPGSET